jgi:hypothetical protein
MSSEQRPSVRRDERVQQSDCPPRLRALAAVSGADEATVRKLEENTKGMAKRAIRAIAKLSE